MEWRERDGMRWLEADLGGARAAFSTRLGGASEPPFDSLNLGILTDDDPKAVTENRRRLALALGLEPEEVVLSLQVHGTRLVEHPCEESVPEADGHVVTESAGLCTSCERELFFSHRRDHGRAGRQAGIAWIEE
jgi:copper oxidase (laccase) domain-containing protein